MTALSQSNDRQDEYETIYTFLRMHGVFFPRKI